MTTTTGPDARASVPTHASSYGNLSIAHRGKATAASMAQNDVIRLGRVPKGSDVYGIHRYNAALGASTALTYGYEAVDGSPVSAAYFATVADASTASSDFVACVPFTAQEDLYLTVTQTGAGSASGLISGHALYNFTNSVE